MKYYSRSRILDKYSRDRSIYRIIPSLVAFPKTEEDLIQITNDAREKKLSITPRGGGTGLSGAGIGKGIIVDMTKYFTKIYKVGSITRVQSGILLKKLRPKVEKSGYYLPSVPLHGECAIGGNVNTNSVGPKTVKYGTMQNQVKSVRGVLADGRILDTSKKIPSDIAERIIKLTKQIRKDKILVKFLKKRSPIGGGYDLNSFLKYKNVNDIITHLVVSSVGTLIILTEVTMKLPKYKELENLYLIHFKSYDDLQ